jgi:hypothetical protein
MIVRAVQAGRDEIANEWLRQKAALRQRSYTGVLASIQRLAALVER